MSKIEGPVSGNSVRTELFWCNACVEILGLILVISFVFEVIGPTYMKLFMFPFRSTYGFFNGLR